jgi:hypothetical protein
VVSVLSDKENVVYEYTMEYYASLKKKTLSFATTWISLQDIMLSEVEWSLSEVWGRERKRCWLRYRNISYIEGIRGF